MEKLWKHLQFSSRSRLGQEHVTQAASAGLGSIRLMIMTNNHFLDYADEYNKLYILLKADLFSL